MENNEKKTNEEEENEKTGKLSGLGAGVITGAVIGSVVPIVGTFVGGVVGGVVGSEVGKKYGGSLLNKFSGKDKNQAASAEKTDVTAELQKLAKLHKDGVLDDDEFKAAKAALLNL
ncbi:MAG: SHOCT domain-containing protein [Pyrinomonadaceae bacterium]